jgi:TP901 family phage tail tape measure protein
MPTEKFDISVILSFIDKSAKGLKGFQANMSKVGKKMQSVGRTMSVAVTAPIVALGANAIRIGSEFQAAMNMVGAVTNTTGEQFEKLKVVARDLGSTTQFSARQAGEAMKFMGMAGFDANKIIAASPKVLELAAAAQLDMGSAADITTNIMSGFGFQAEEMARVNDVLVNTFTSANVSLPQLGEALKKVGPVASQMKFRFTEVTSALGLMGNAGIQGSEAGVALRRALINLQKPTKQQQQAMNFLELEFKNADGTLKDLTGIIGEYENAAKKGAEETEIMTSMMTIFGPRAVAPMLALLEQGSKGLADMEEKTRKQGTSSMIATRQMKGLPGALKEMTSAWESLNIALTEGDFGKWTESVVRGLADIIRSVAGFINTHPEITKWGVIVAGIFAATGPLLIALGAASVVIGAISLPVVGVIAGVTALAALGIVLYNNWEGIAGVFNEIVQSLKDLGTAVGADIWNFLSGGVGPQTQKKSYKEIFMGKETMDKITANKAREQGLPALVDNKSEITIRVESANGTSAAVTGVKTGNSKLKVKNESNVGPTLGGIALATGGL